MALRSTKPRFLLTGRVCLTIQRNTTPGGYVKGKWVDGEYQPIQRDVNIQPLQYHQTLLLPESERTKQWYVLFCAEELRASQEPGFLEDGTPTEGWQADKFIWEGHLYEIMKVRSWGMGVLDHWEAQAARIPITPN